MSANLLKQLAVRRSIYALGKEKLSLSDSEIVDTVQNVLKITPSTFNSQTNRAVVLFGKHHEKLWNEIAPAAVRKAFPTEPWDADSKKLAGFAAAYGTILFFQESWIMKNLQKQFVFYADKFPEWAAHSTGAATISTWQALALDGIGANLQHFNPLINDAVAKEWDIDTNWTLTGQLVFGSITSEPVEKDTLEATVKSFS